MLSGSEYLFAFPRVNRILLRRGYVMFCIRTFSRCTELVCEEARQEENKCSRELICGGIRFAVILILYDTTYTIIFYWPQCVVPDEISSLQGRRAPAGARFAAPAVYDYTQDRASSNGELRIT